MQTMKSKLLPGSPGNPSLPSAPGNPGFHKKQNSMMLNQNQKENPSPTNPHKDDTHIIIIE